MTDKGTILAVSLGLLGLGGFYTFKAWSMWDSSLHSQSWQEHEIAAYNLAGKKRFAEAQRQYGLALQEADKTGTEKAEAALTLLDLASVMSKQGNLARAAALYQQAGQIYERLAKL